VEPGGVLSQTIYIWKRENQGKIFQSSRAANLLTIINSVIIVSDDNEQIPSSVCSMLGDHRSAIKLDRTGSDRGHLSQHGSLPKTVAEKVT